MSANKDSIMMVRKLADGRWFRILPDGREVPWTPPEMTEEDWAALDARSDEELTRAAESDPDNPPLTEEDFAAGRLKFVGGPLSAEDIRAIREKTGLGQAEFARTFGFSVATYRDWEYGRRAPRGPAITLLRVIEQDPEAVRRVISAA